MRPIRWFAITAAALVAACSNPEGSASEPASANAASKTPAASKTSNESLLGPDDAVASQEEADQAAEKSIDDQNADAEFDKLEKELAGAGGG